MFWELPPLRAWALWSSGVWRVLRVFRCAVFMHDLSFLCQSPWVSRQLVSRQLVSLTFCIYLLHSLYLPIFPSPPPSLPPLHISLPITAWASQRIQVYQTRMMGKKDARMSVMNEILQGEREGRGGTREVCVDRFLGAVACWRRVFLRSAERTEKDPG